MTPLPFWLIAINFWAFAAMVWDKHRAETGGRRVAEANLIGLFLLGGAAGGFAASRLVRHKTRKQPFAAIMLLILVGELALFALWWLGLLDPVLAQIGARS